MFPEPDSLRPLTSGMRTHRRRTMHLRLHDAEPTTRATARRVAIIHAVGASLVLAACAAPTDDAGLMLMTTQPAQSAQTNRSAQSSPSAQSTQSLTESSARSPVSPVSPTSQRGDATPLTPDVSAGRTDDQSPAGNASVSDAFSVLVRRRVECLTNPQRCDVADFTAPGSSEARRMGDTVARFRREGLRLSPQRGRLELTVNAITLDPASGDVVVGASSRRGDRRLRRAVQGRVA